MPGLTRRLRESNSDKKRKMIFTLGVRHSDVGTASMPSVPSVPLWFNPSSALEYGGGFR